MGGSGVVGQFPTVWPVFGPRFGATFRFSAQNPPESLELGQTKARNGFSTLKIGISHVVGPWDPPFPPASPTVLPIARASKSYVTAALPLVCNCFDCTDAPIA